MIFIKIYKKGGKKDIWKFNSKLGQTHFVYLRCNQITCQKKKEHTKPTSRKWLTKYPTTNVSPHRNLEKRKECYICSNHSYEQETESDKPEVMDNQLPSIENQVVEVNLPDQEVVDNIDSTDNILDSKETKEENTDPMPTFFQRNCLIL